METEDILLLGGIGGALYWWFYLRKPEEPAPAGPAAPVPKYLATVTTGQTPGSPIISAALQQTIAATQAMYATQPQEAPTPGYTWGMDNSTSPPTWRQVPLVAAPLPSQSDEDAARAARTAAYLAERAAMIARG